VVFVITYFLNEWNLKCKLWHVGGKGGWRKIVLKLRKGPQTLEVHSTTAVTQEFPEVPKTSNLLKAL